MSPQSQTLGEAMNEVAERFARLKRSLQRGTRYLAADMHRHRLVQTGKYVKTSRRTR